MDDFLKGLRTCPPAPGEERVKKLDQCIEAGDMDGAAAVKKRIDEL